MRRAIATSPTAPLVVRACNAEKAPPALNVGLLFNQYRRYVAKIGGRMLGSGSEVDDLVQDVFLAAHEDLHQLADASLVKGWLATVTIRVSRRHLQLRSRNRRIGRIEPVELSHMSSVALSPELKADLTNGVKRCGDLPGHLRTPWLLKHIECETLPRIADRCHCSPSTAQRRISDAGLRLASKLPRASS